MIKDTAKKLDTHSLSEIYQTVTTQPNAPSRWKRLFSFLGPAYLISVGYMDPGNWATDLQGGAQFGYQLIWVLLMSNLMAIFLQGLSARLGIVCQKDLAQVNRIIYPPFVNFCLYLLAEIAIIACDLAEVLGMALGIYLLTGLPLMVGVMISVADTFLLLWLQSFGIRKLEAFIFSLVIIIAGSFFIEIWLVKPDISAVIKGFVPTKLNKEALYIAIGIIGATVMPHNLYLHSALVQSRKIEPTIPAIKKALWYNNIDSIIALNAAFFVNAAILVVAASGFYYTGHSAVARIEDAHQLLEPILGSKLAPILFAIALIAAGQSSTVTSTLAGQIIMEGYLQIKIRPWIRRLITRLLAIIPAVIVLAIYGNDEIDKLLVFSQVVLSMQLGFAIIPLIHCVSNKAWMGVFTLKIYVQMIAWLIAGILILLNLKMVAEEVYIPIFSNFSWSIKNILIIFVGIFFCWLFLTMTFYPYKRKKILLYREKVNLGD